MIDSKIMSRVETQIFLFRASKAQIRTFKKLEIDEKLLSWCNVFIIISIFSYKNSRFALIFLS